MPESGLISSRISRSSVVLPAPFGPIDHVVVTPSGCTFLAQPGIARLRLWPASLPVLDLAAGDLPRVFSRADKRVIDVSESVDPGRLRSRPLAAVYILAPLSSALGVPAVEPLAAPAALHQLLVQRFGPFTISSEHAAAEMAHLGRLARTVPIRRLHRPQGLDTLDRVVATVCADLAAIGSP